MKINDNTFKIVACLIGFSLFMAINIKLWPVYKVLGKASKLKYIDGRIADEREYIGEKIIVQPIAKLGKLKGHTNGYRDNYHYLIPDNTSYLKDETHLPTDVIDITEPTIFRVIEQRYATSGMRVGIFCVLRSDTGLTFAEECTQIKKLVRISDFLMNLRLELLEKKEAYVGLFLFEDAKEMVFKVNNVQVIKIKSEEELFEAFDDDRNDIPLDITMLDKEKLFLTSKVLKESEFYTWHYLKLPYQVGGSPESLFAENKIPDAVLQTIQSLAPNSINNRWLLGLIYDLAKNGYLYKDNYDCFRNKYEGGHEKFDRAFQKLKEVSTIPEINFEFIDYHQFKCNYFKPPKAYKEAKIIEGLI